MDKAFSDLLNAAIEDLTIHGFDNVARVAAWMDKIRAAAEATMRSQHELDQMLRDAMNTVFRRMIEQGVVLKHHPGIHRFTLDMVRPAARAELDRRIMASAELIRLNRKQAIEKTLQRFSGWSTSIPKGGSRTVNRTEVRKDLKRPMQRLPFEERRVLVDQGHKLRASISDVIAKDNQALAAIWHSHWRQAGYDYREPHKQLDEKGVFAIRGNWAIEKGLMKPGPNGYTDQIEAPAELPFCRCYYQYIYNVDALPADMLTEKGRRELQRATEALA